MIPLLTSLEIKEKAIWKITKYKSLSCSQDTLTIRTVENNIKIPLYKIARSFYDPQTNAQQVRDRFFIVIGVMFLLAVAVLVVMLYVRKVRKYEPRETRDLQAQDEWGYYGKLRNSREDLLSEKISEISSENRVSSKFFAGVGED